MMEESLAIQAISSVGFPIIVTVYFMFKVNKTMEENTKAIRLLGELLYQNGNCKTPRERKNSLQTLNRR